MPNIHSPRYRLIILIGSVFVSGVAQGMLLPLVSILLEQDGTPAALNGFNASALYIGILLVSPFMEKPLRRFGYRPVLACGLFLTAACLLLFPAFHAYWIWFLLRLLIGIGDNMLHFSAQVWIMFSSPADRKGRHLSIYGLVYGLGFAAGPLLTRLIRFGVIWPFLIVALVCALFFLAALMLKNDYPTGDDDATGRRFAGFIRYQKALALAWSGLFATFSYGVIEAALNGSFPVFAVRNGFSVNTISLILPAFVIGSLITQIPLGALGDRIGRRNVLLWVTLLGTVGFSAAIFLAHSPVALAVIFLFTGMCVGSLYSMGMTFVSDLLPKALLPVGNILAGAAFSFGSMIGPSVGGLFIKWFSGGMFFAVIAAPLFLTFLGCFFQGLIGHAEPRRDGR